MSRNEFHIIPPISDYRRRSVLCNEPRHRHRRHVEEYTTAHCGLEVVRDRDQYLNIGVVDPVGRPEGMGNVPGGGPRPWCVDCVSDIPWKPEYVAKLKELGLWSDKPNPNGLMKGNQREGTEEASSSYP